MLKRFFAKIFLNITLKLLGMDTKAKKYIATYTDDEEYLTRKAYFDSSSLLEKDVKYYEDGTIKELSKYEFLICTLINRFDEKGTCNYIMIYDTTMSKPFEFDPINDKALGYENPEYKAKAKERSKAYLRLVK